MSQNADITILIAEDNDVSRNLMAGILREQGFNVIGAINGESAIKVVRENHIDLAFVDINMAPTSGFDFIRYLVAQGIKIPVVIVTADESSHILLEASAHGVAQVIQKPIEPTRLIKTVHRILKKRGLVTSPLAVETHQSQFSPEELMQKAIALAAENARRKMGGPYGAVLADTEGRIISEGVNGAGSRADPTAHAEVMAIRLAADRLGTADMSDYILYCSSQPTGIGHALIESVGIKLVCYGISHDEMAEFYQRQEKSKPKYRQLEKDAALAMLRAARG